MWDWRKGRILSSTRGHNDRIFDVQFNPFLPNTLVTCGVKHIKFWSMSGNSLTGKKGIFGRVGEGGACDCDVCVWVDEWVGGVSLCMSYHDLYMYVMYPDSV